MARVSDDWRTNVVALVAVVLICAVMLWWISGVEASCEERGGVMVWEVNSAASNAYGECVGP